MVNRVGPWVWGDWNWIFFVLLSITQLFVFFLQKGTLVLFVPVRIEKSFGTICINPVHFIRHDTQSYRFLRRWNTIFLNHSIYLFSTKLRPFVGTCSHCFQGYCFGHYLEIDGLVVKFVFLGVWGAEERFEHGGERRFWVKLLVEGGILEHDWG